MPSSDTKSLVKNLRDYDGIVDNIFPTAILALVSIIQGVSFYILIDKFFSIMTSRGRLLSEIVEISGFFAFSLILITVILYEYFWFINLFTGHSNAFDILSVILLGVFEIAPMYFMNDMNWCDWYLFTSLLFAMGWLAYTNSIYKAKNICYSPAEISIRIVDCTKLHRKICVAAGITSLGGFISAYHNVPYLPYLMLPVLYVFEILIFRHNHRFINGIRELCVNHELAADNILP